MLIERRAHLSTAGDFHTVDGSGDFDGADAAVLAALLADVLQDLLVVFVIHQLLRHHHVEKAQHLRGHARVLQPLEPRDLQRHRGLYDGGLWMEEECAPQSDCKFISHKTLCFLPFPPSLCLWRQLTCWSHFTVDLHSSSCHREKTVLLLVT